MIEGGMSVHATQQRADCTPIEKPCPFAVCVLPESDLRLSEHLFLSLFGDETAFK
jgi:hypothetical protein